MKGIAKIFEIAAVFFLALMVISVLVQVFSRFLGNPIVWSEELTRIFLLYASFMGGALAYYKGKGFKITILVDSFPPNVRKAVELIVLIFSMALLTFVVYSIFLYISNTGSSTTPLLDISHTFILISMPIGYILILIRMITDFKQTILNN